LFPFQELQDNRKDRGLSWAADAALPRLMLAQVVLAFEPQLGLLRGFAGSLTAALIDSMSRP
jgi:hypothetical protein